MSAIEALKQVVASRKEMAAASDAAKILDNTLEMTFGWDLTKFVPRHMLQPGTPLSKHLLDHPSVRGRPTLMIAPTSAVAFTQSHACSQTETAKLDRHVQHVLWAMQSCTNLTLQS
jgi:hypothetical protein